jgi:hypothetical protein
VLDGAGGAAADDRATTETGDQPVHGTVRLVVDVRDGVQRQTHLLGDRIWDAPVEQRHAQPLGHLGPDDAATRAVQRCERDHGTMSMGDRHAGAAIRATPEPAEGPTGSSRAGRSVAIIV